MEQLLSLLAEQGVDVEKYHPLLNAEVCAPHMRSYKLDVSISLKGNGPPRMSINDTGEPASFRERLLQNHEQLGLSRETLRDFFAQGNTDAIQTTLSLKWEASLRTTLYFEELYRLPQPLRFRESLFEHYIQQVPPATPYRLISLGVDFVEGKPVELREYYRIDLQREPHLAPELAPLLKVHPYTGEKRAMFAQRYDMDGRWRGDKLLWVTEANTPTLAGEIWRHVAWLVRQFNMHSSPNWRRLLGLIGSWQWGPSCVPYPDLVSFNRSPDGEIDDLILYVSLK